MNHFAGRKQACLAACRAISGPFAGVVPQKPWSSKFEEKHKFTLVPKIVNFWESQFSTPSPNIKDAMTVHDPNKGTHSRVLMDGKRVSLYARQLVSQLLKGTLLPF